VEGDEVDTTLSHCRPPFHGTFFWINQSNITL